MKKLILLALTAVIMAGCDKFQEAAIYLDESFRKQPLLRTGMIITIDSCQYVVGDAYGGYVYTHHNNCRFCAERRKQELQNIVEQLKENNPYEEKNL